MTIDYATRPKTRNWFSTWGKWVFLGFTGLVMLIALAGNIGSKCGDEEVLKAVDKMVLGRVLAKIDPDSVVTRGALASGNGYACSINIVSGLAGPQPISIDYTVVQADKGGRYMVQLK